MTRPPNRWMLADGLAKRLMDMTMRTMIMGMVTMTTIMTTGIATAGTTAG